MTFPNIPADVVDDAILNLAGENASRAAVFTAGQQVKFVIEALQSANANSANCDTCGHFHPTTEHPTNAHSAETTPEPDGDSERCTKSHKGGDFDTCLAAHLDMLENSMRYGHRKLYAGVHYPEVLAKEAFAQYKPQPAPAETTPKEAIVGEVPAGAVTYSAIPKLERESGGDKTGTWDWDAMRRANPGVEFTPHADGSFTATAPEVNVKGAPWDVKKGDLIGFTRHDHAMCDPDRSCGDEHDANTRAVYVGARRTGKTTEAARKILDYIDSEVFENATRVRKPRLASFFKDTSPAAAAEQAAMQRLSAAQELRDSLGSEPSASSMPAFFPGGRMWSENQEREGLQRLMTDVEAGPDDYTARKHDDHLMDSFRYPPATETGGPVPPTDDECCTAYAEHGSAPTPEEKLRIISDIVEGQAPFGSDLANFQRRLRLILDMQ